MNAAWRESEPNQFGTSKSLCSVHNSEARQEEYKNGFRWTMRCQMRARHAFRTRVALSECHPRCLRRVLIVSAVSIGALELVDESSFVRPVLGGMVSLSPYRTGC